jgi:hypothetical protein
MVKTLSNYELHNKLVCLDEAPCVYNIQPVDDFDPGDDSIH